MRLYRLAKEELKRQELRQKMRACDNEVFVHYIFILASTLKYKVWYAAFLTRNGPKIVHAHYTNIDCFECYG